MAIVIEDGTNVPNANSYASVAELVAYAAERNITIPAGNPEREVMLIKAMDYLETLERRLPGYRSFDDQTTAYPRTYRGRDVVPPANLKKAQIILAIASLTMDLLPVSAGSSKLATRKKVGPLEVEYSTGSSSSSMPYIPQAMALLNGVFGAGAGQIRVIRG